MSSQDGEQDKRSGISRRDYLIGSALGVGAMSGLAEALNTGGDDVLEVGDVALSSPTNVAGDLYIGPEAAVTGANPEIAPAAGRVYIARDTEVQYTADGANWKLMSVGSAQTQVPDGHFDALQADQLDIAFDVDNDSVIINADRSSLNYSSIESGKNHPIQIQASEEEGGTGGGRSINLLAASNSSGDQGERPNVLWLSDKAGSGERETLATMVAHPSDNHFSIYTKKNSLGSGDGSGKKRLDIEGGSADTKVAWNNISNFRVNHASPIQIYSTSGASEVQVRSEDNTTDARLVFEEGTNGNKRLQTFWDASIGKVNLQNKNGNFLQVDDSSNNLTFSGGSSSSVDTAFENHNIFKVVSVDNSSDARIQINEGTNGNERLRMYWDASLSRVAFRNKDNRFLSVDDANDEVTLLAGGSEVYTLTGSTETGDGMTADPETAQEDAFVSVDIGSNSYQIPLYSA